MNSASKVTVILIKCWGFIINFSIVSRGLSRYRFWKDNYFKIYYDEHMFNTKFNQ